MIRQVVMQSCWGFWSVVDQLEFFNDVFWLDSLWETEVLFNKILRVTQIIFLILNLENYIFMDTDFGWISQEVVDTFR